MHSRRFKIFVAILIVAAMLYWMLGRPLRAWFGLSATGYWLVVFVVGAIAAMLSRDGSSAAKSLDDDDGEYARGGEFLCDSCKYNSAPAESRGGRSRARNRG
jgi:uncharacterized membrane protein YiaA